MQRYGKALTDRYAISNVCVCLVYQDMLGNTYDERNQGRMYDVRLRYSEKD